MNKKHQTQVTHGRTCERIYCRLCLSLVSCFARYSRSIWPSCLCCIFDGQGYFVREETTSVNTFFLSTDRTARFGIAKRLDIRTCVEQCIHYSDVVVRWRPCYSHQDCRIYSHTEICMINNNHEFHVKELSCLQKVEKQSVVL